MSETSRHDAWQIGASYDSYMGRWSRQLAPQFLRWLDMADGLDWLEVGCGTGALSAAIVAECGPRSLVSIDPSEGFIEAARANVPDARAVFQIGDAQTLTQETASRDVIVSALVLNFVPDRGRALSEMKRVARLNGTVAYYVWDYPGGGVEFMQAFWNAAISLDPSARDLTEDRRFAFCTPDGLRDLTEAAGLASVDVIPIEVPTLFPNFDNYWHPFTLGAGPAPGYCMSLTVDARHRLKERLRDSLPRGADGSIPMKARAWAVKAAVA